MSCDLGPSVRPFAQRTSLSERRPTLSAVCGLPEIVERAWFNADGLARSAIPGGIESDGALRVWSLLDQGAGIEVPNDFSLQPTAGSRPFAPTPIRPPRR